MSIASSTKPAILSMTKKGLAVLGRYRPDVVERARPPGAIKLGAVDHHCARVDVRSFMEAWARDVRGARLADWSPTMAIKELAGHQDIATTQKYMHLSPAAKDTAIALLNAEAVQGYGNLTATENTKATNP